MADVQSLVFAEVIRHSPVIDSDRMPVLVWESELTYFLVA